ncbi:hypothetical protein EDD11_002183 [Mortierella claussenii]|nr:hypothetical protein EDD11_002183 [Mortierella claussenii]
MASIMPFPNVATHRRMPHLSNTSKAPSPQQSNQNDTLQQQLQLQQQQVQAQQVDYSRNQENAASSTLRLAAPGMGSSSTQQQRLVEDSIALAASASPVTRAIQDTNEARRSSLLPPDDHHSTISRPTSPLSHALQSPPSTATSPSMTLQDSKMIKNALYDAFGVLYHPSAHTKHSLTSNAAAPRSGDVTPLMGLSPKASPLLRPNMGPSAPITPLELSEEGSAAGYFALNVPTSPALNGVPGAGSTGTRHHHHHHYHHPRQNHGSSHLSANFTSEDYEGSSSSSSAVAGSSHGHRSPLSLSRRQSVDMLLNPEEHPVLSSLQTLSITHPHPPEHYHPHLGHELGHDRIPIEDGSVLQPAPAAALNSTALSTTTSSAQSLTPETPLSNKLMGPTMTSLFPMDRADHDSISGFGQRGLV